MLLPLFLSLLAHAYQRAGHYNLALQTLDSALCVITRTGEHNYCSRTYATERRTLSYPRRENSRGWECNTRMDLVYPQTKSPNPYDEENTQSTTAQAESYFQEALVIARQQDAKSWNSGLHSA